MYSDNNRRYAARRADEEFLRRMMGGDLSGNGLPVMNTAPNAAPTQPMRDARVRVACDGTRNTGKCGGTDAHSPTPCENDSFAPSLAMVYSPRQCWKGILEPLVGLSKGTIFSELVLPLEAVPHHGSKEVKIR